MPLMDFTQGTFKPPRYIPVRIKFVLAFAFACMWCGISIYLAQHWFAQLSLHIGKIPASLVILGVAIIPGFMNAFLLAGLVLDRRPKRKKLDVYPPLSILTAAYNEEDSIAETLAAIARQQYTGQLEVIVINDGSRDKTAEILADAARRFAWLKVISLPLNGGKAKALNQGFAHSTHDLVITLDADSYLYRDALQSIVERYLEDPANTRAVAGTVLVHNSRESWITRAQEWDYFHGIASIKRVQSLFQGTMVAQGAFSLYSREAIIEVGGWVEGVGEDIILTWAILHAGYRVGHSEDACAFTNVPATLRQFSHQRQRWSRGMIEAFKRYPGLLLKPRLSTMFVYWNLMFPFLDLIFTISFLPGIALALFGYFWIVGPMTLALIPIAAGMNYLMFGIGKTMFNYRGLHVRHNIKGLLVYTLTYNLLMQPICLMGYLSELLTLKKNWGTK